MSNGININDLPIGFCKKCDGSGKEISPYGKNTYRTCTKCSGSGLEKDILKELNSE